MATNRTSSTTNPAAAAPDDTEPGKVDNGALPSDGEQTVNQPEPEREGPAAQREKPSTGVTPGGTAGGRRI
jgi:hypothetical protein